jgi:hypothetical protein
MARPQVVCAKCRGFFYPPDNAPMCPECEDSERGKMTEIKFDEALATSVALETIPWATEMLRDDDHGKIALRFAVRCMRWQFTQDQSKLAELERGISWAKIEVANLKEEIEFLRRYGNKACTQMADEALEKHREGGPDESEG